MMELHTLLQSDLDSEQRRMLHLASLAVLDVFDTALKSNAEAAKAGLAPRTCDSFRCSSLFLSAFR